MQRLVGRLVSKSNTEETKHVIISRHENSGRNHNSFIDNRSFENMVKFKTLGKTVTNQITFKKK
jgi:hypothetical protein